jgi:hypothetical protein
MPSAPESRSIPVWLWLVVWTLCVGVTLAFQPGTSAERRMNSVRAQVMKPEDRAQLERNWTEYQALPAGERDQIRQLHAELQPQADLASVFKDYLDWVEDAERQLEPEDLARLEAESAPSRKAGIVRELIGKQKDAYRRQFLVDAADPRAAFQRGLSPGDLDAIRQVLEPVLKKNLPPEQWKKIDESQGLTRLVRVLNVTFEGLKTGKWRETGLTTDDIGRSVIDAISDPATREVIDGQPSRERKQHLVRDLLIQAVSRQMRNEVVTSEEMTSAEQRMNRFASGWFRSLPEDQRDFVLRMAAHRERYPEFANMIDQQLRERGFPMFGGGPPRPGEGGRRPPFGGPGGPGGGGPGDFGPEGRGPGRRGPDGRGPDGRGPEGRGFDGRDGDGPRRGPDDRPPPPRDGDDRDEPRRPPEGRRPPPPE